MDEGNAKKLAPSLIYLSDGRTYLKEELHYYYVMEFVQGRELQETEEDEFKLGQATAKLHELTYTVGTAHLIVKMKRINFWDGAIYMHIAYMQCSGPEAVDSLWQILKFGMKQKERLYKVYTDDLIYRRKY